MNYLEFVETSAFSGLRKELMDDDEFRELQTYLLEAMIGVTPSVIPVDAGRFAGVARGWVSEVASG